MMYLFIRTLEQANLLVELLDCLGCREENFQAKG